MSEDSSFKLVLGYGLAEYSTDLRSGDVVVNSSAIEVRQSDGLVAMTIPAGTLHFVLQGQVDYPGDVWLGRLEPERERHIWELRTFWDTFEKTSEEHNYSHGDF